MYDNLPLLLLLLVSFSTESFKGLFSGAEKTRPKCLKPVELNESEMEYRAVSRSRRRSIERGTSQAIGP